MVPLRRQILLNTLKLFDLLVMVLSFALATLVVSYQLDATSLEDFLSMRIQVKNFGLFIGFLAIWHIIFAVFGLYYSRRLSTRWAEVIDVIKASSVGSVVIFITSTLLKISLATPIFILVFWIGSSGMTILGRLLLRQILKWLRLRGRNLRFMLIVGTNERAVGFSRKIASHPELGYSLTGFVENDWRGNQNFLSTGHRIVTDLDGFPSFIRKNVVDEVVVCLPVRSFYNEISSIAKICEEQGIIFRHFSDLYDSKLARSRTDHFEGESVVTHYTGSMSGLQALIKRIIDILLSFFFLMVFSPLFLTVAVLIKCTSPGPVFFVQERVGLNKRRFSLYKFRTMIMGAEEKQAELEHLNELCGPVFKIKNDPRITPLGKILRKTSTDELPQLYNVFKGDMSLVGPRALPLRDCSRFDQDRHRRRFSVRPGMTCLWQVNGRNNIPFEKWMELDLKYIDNWSLWLDLKILLKTIPAVLSGSGAE